MVHVQEVMAHVQEVMAHVQEEEGVFRGRWTWYPWGHLLETGHGICHCPLVPTEPQEPAKPLARPS